MAAYSHRQGYFQDSRQDRDAAVDALKEEASAALLEKVGEERFDETQELPCTPNSSRPGKAPSKREQTSSSDSSSDSDGSSSSESEEEDEEEEDAIDDPNDESHHESSEPVTPKKPKKGKEGLMRKRTSEECSEEDSNGEEAPSSATAPEPKKGKPKTWVIPSLFNCSWDHSCLFLCFAS